MRSRGSRGASSTEYALLIALLGGGLCLGIGTVANDLFRNSVCTIEQFLGGPSCSSDGSLSEIPDPTPDPSGGSTGNPGPDPSGALSSPSPSTACPEPAGTPPSSASVEPTPSCSIPPGRP